jgi:WD40-like Beta Propeller Repeat
MGGAAGCFTARRTAWPTAPSLVLALLASEAVACNAGRVVQLGALSPPPYHFGAPQLITELASTQQTGNPTLTADLLEIYFTVEVPGDSGDVWFSTRSAANLPFAAPAPVAGVNTPSFETSSAISADGLTLWFGSDRPGGVGAIDVWVSTRPRRTDAWSTPLNVVALNSAVDDIPRPPGEHDLVMPLASQRNADDVYQTYLAARSAAGAPFRAPALISELAFADRSTVDSSLTDDGLTLFFSSTPVSRVADGGAASDAAVATGDLYVAWRRSTDELFSMTQPLDDLNTPSDERDPWLSPDGKLLFFTSDRGGVLSIYVASVDPR